MIGNQDALSPSDWVVVIDAKQSESLAALWSVPSVLICALDEKIWVRGGSLDDEDALLVRSLPAEQRYVLRSDRQLQNVGQRLPVAMLPEGNWVSLREFFRVTAPAALFPATIPTPSRIRLVRSPRGDRCNLMVTSFGHWYRFVLSAPAVRLKQLRFAVGRKKGLTVVRGLPLPTLHGRQFVEKQGVALPAGFVWQPAVSAQSVARRCELAEGDLALFDESGSWHHIPSSEFVVASRSSVRVTQKGRLPPGAGS